MPSPQRFHYDDTIEMMLCGSAMNFDVRVTYDFTPATPASGFYGRPEHFDPGCGCEVEIVGIVLRAEGQENWFIPEAWLLDSVRENFGLIDKLEEDGRDQAIDAALGALDARDEDRAERAREDRHDAAE